MNGNFAVGFDFDHTLGIDHGLERHAYERLAAELGVAPALEDSQRKAALEELLARFRANELSLEAAVEAFVTGIIEVARGHAPRPATERYREICYQLVDELVQPMAGAAELLGELAQRGVRTAILTNGWSPLQQLKIARALGAYGGAVLVSDQIGTAKPAGVAFARLADALQCARGSIWYVGDNPLVDVAGAHAAGMRAAWFDWEGLGYPAELAPPDARIHNLLDFLAVVRGS